MKRIGIDLGGTKIEGLLLDRDGKTLKRERMPTNRENGYRAIINSIVDLIIQIQPGDEDFSVGVCTPGSISPVSGRLRNSNTVCLIDKPVKEDLAAALSMPVYIENDANCFACAEALLGAGKGHSVVFGVIMGTGVGGGIIINDRIHRGRMHIAGEWGHTSLIPGGNKCYCGQYGCVETVLSGPALEASWFEKTGHRIPLKQISNTINSGENLTPEMLAWKDEFLRYFGLALGNVITILDPDIVVLGGGVSNIPFLYTEGIGHVHDHVFSEFTDTMILKNKLGDSGGVYGAALLPGMQP